MYRHSIDALTLQGVETSPNRLYDPPSEQATFTGTAHSLMAILRTLSNLEEDLHHSVAFYFMQVSEYECTPQESITFACRAQIG